jgi:hypothetical protein
VTSTANRVNDSDAVGVMPSEVAQPICSNRHPKLLMKSGLAVYYRLAVLSTLVKMQRTSQVR